LHRGRAHLCHQRGEGTVVEGFAPSMELVGAAFVMDRRRGQPRSYQFDPTPVDHLVIGVGRDGDRPAEVVGDAEAHVAIMPLGFSLGFLLWFWFG
jgi:hypothetical protein